MSLLLNMLSKFVIAFFPKSKHFNFMTSATIHSDFGVQEDNTANGIMLCDCMLL